MKSTVTAVAVIAIFAVGFVVGRMSAPAEGSATPSTTAFAPSMGAPNMPMGAAPSAPMMGQPPSNGVSGTVAEVIQVPNYTYLRLTTPSGDEWAAVSTNNNIAVGQSVALTASTQMSNFNSKTLNRTFESIWFGQLAGAVMAPSDPAPGMEMGELPPGHPPTTSLAAQAADALKGVGTSQDMKLSAVYADRLSLVGRRVRVSGTVKDVKVVAGMTHLHLSDGSGGKDLPVVTRAALGKDEVVTLEGLVAVDKDPGTGTSEPVVVEDAQVLAR